MTTATWLRRPENPWRQEAPYEDTSEADSASPGSVPPGAPAPLRLRGGARLGRRQRVLGAAPGVRPCRRAPGGQPARAFRGSGALRARPAGAALAADGRDL